jgi:two-component system, OmpR family, response regulator
MARSSTYDAIVLDVILPGIDGFETCRQMRVESIWTPVLMLTARGALEDRVSGLDGGADDYLTKPFSFAELLARLRALVRRGQAERPSIIEVGDLRLDPATHQVWRGEAEINLSAKELVLLETFMRSPGHVLTRTHLLEQAWEYDFEHRSNVIEVYIRYLRRKIDAPFGVKSIETVRGAGYRLRKDGVYRSDCGSRSSSSESWHSFSAPSASSSISVSPPSWTRRSTPGCDPVSCGGPFALRPSSIADRCPAWRTSRAYSPLLCEREARGSSSSWAPRPRRELSR